MSKSKKKQTKKKVAKKTTKKQSTNRAWLPWAAGACVLALIAMFPVFSTEFINYDDDLYIFENPLILTGQIGALFSEFYQNQYAPIPMTLMAMLFKMFGVKAGGVKAFSVLLHLANVYLVFLLTHRLFGKTALAFFVAALFGVAPIQVESVGWLAASFKIGTYAFFFLVSLLTYLKYLDQKNKSYLIGSIVLFIMSCMCKEQAVALAPTLLAVDYVRKRNLLSKDVIMEKIPYFIIALFFGFLTLKASQSLENQQDVYAFNIVERFLFALYAVGAYFVKLIIPFDLSAFYTYPIKGQVPPSFYLFALITLGMIGAFVMSLLKGNRIITFALLFFAFNIGLTMLTQIMSVRDVIMADRYVYISANGWFIMIGYLLENFVGKKIGEKPAQYAGLAFVLLMTALSFNRAGVWKNSGTVFSDVIKKETLSNGKLNPYLALPLNNRGIWRKRNGDPNGAFQDFEKAINSNPKYASAYQNRGNIFFNQNKDNQALPDYDKALSLEPKNAKALSARGAIYAKRGQYDKALTDLNQAIEIENYFADALSNRSLIFFQQRKYQEALNDISRILEFKPDAHDLLSMRGICYTNLNQHDKAMQDHNRAIALSPNVANYYSNRSLAHKTMGNTAEAQQDAEKARQLGGK